MLGTDSAVEIFSSAVCRRRQRANGVRLALVLICWCCLHVSGLGWGWSVDRCVNCCDRCSIWVEGGQKMAFWVVLGLL